MNAEQTELAVDEPQEVEEAVETDVDAGDDGAHEVEAQERGDDDSDDGDEDEQPGPELVDVEYGGKSFKVAPELKDALMMREDYSRKTQEVADQRKAFEAEQQAYHERAKVESELGQELTTLRSGEERLEQFGQLNWAELQQSDPNLHAGLLAEYTMLQHQVGTMRGQVAAKHQHLTLQRQQETAKRAEQVKAEIAARVPDWNEQKLAEIRTYATKKGVAERDLMAAVGNDAYIADILADAAFGYRVKSERKNTKASRPVEATPGPLPQLGGKASQKRGPTDRQSVDEWMKARNRERRRSA